MEKRKSYLSKIFHNHKRRKTTDVFQYKSLNAFLGKIKISEVISRFVVLKSVKGDEASFIGRCPFCKEPRVNEKHFRISDKKRIFKCFYCGKSGRVSNINKIYCFLLKNNEFYESFTIYN